MFFHKQDENGLEVAKAGQIADRWSIGSMVDGWMVDRSNSERLRGFCDRQTDGQTDPQTDICNSRVAFATEN